MFKNTELAIMPTFRCNAHCQMCHIWQYPSKKEEEITLDDIDQLPKGFARINLGGGEPTLRKDVSEIVDLLSKKTRHLEISTNGYFTDKLVSIAKKHPEIRIRISLEGLPRKNDEIRGIRNGFDRAMRSMLKLKQEGIKDIGFAITISHRNAEELVDLYLLCASMGVEFSQCVVHDAWQFRVPYNLIEDKDEVTDQIKSFIRELLLSKRRDLSLRVKDWFRAYLNRGFINFIRGDQRLLPCGAGTDIVFIDPYGEVYPCNALKESMGNIRKNSFEEICDSSQALTVRNKVSECQENCWMVGTSRPAMRKNLLKPSLWVLKNKLRLLFGKNIAWDMNEIPDFPEKEEIKEKEEIYFQVTES
ncbi:MAG TPA: radical SAM protein [Terriglobales bacterium]|nr:radical SAM protein [Terriglobales bacterium]